MTSTLARKSSESTAHSGSSKRPGRLRAWLGFWKEVFRRWSDDSAARMAASLSYYTVFSLAPLLILVISISGLIFGREAAQGQIDNQLGGMIGENSADAVQSMIRSAWQPAKGIVATVIGVVTLLLGASGVMMELKKALNLMWRAQEATGVKAMIKSRVIAFGIILGIGFLLLVSLVITAAMAVVGEYLSGALPVPEIVLQGINLVLSLGVISLLFAMLYKWLPDTQIAWKDVWVGSLVTTALFTIGKTILGVYLGKGATASSYGAASSVLVILLWVYYSGAILYLGAEFTAVYAERYGSWRGKTPREKSKDSRAG